MAAVQMNTRIDAELKAEGDAAFAELGYSPSEAVRLMWGFAARNRRNRRELLEVIDRLRDPREVEAERKSAELREAETAEWLTEWDAIYDHFLDEAEIDRNNFEPTTSANASETLGQILDEDFERIRLGMSAEDYDRVLFERWRAKS